MTDFQDLLRKPLSSGGHAPEDGEQCVMEKVSLLWALATGRDVSAAFSALPECTNRVIAQVAQIVNDCLDDRERQQLNAFLPRLLRARRTDSDRRVNVRLTLWAARRVLHLIESDQDRAVAEQQLAAVEAWLAGDIGDEEIYAAATALAGSYAAATAAAPTATTAAWAAAYAAATAPVTYAYAVDAAVAAATATAPTATTAALAATYTTEGESLISFLDELLDQWEEAVAKETPEALYIPQDWEDDALAFVAELMGGDPA